MKKWYVGLFLTVLAVGALVITGLDEFLFKHLFESGHQLFFGLLLAAVIVWAPTGLLGARIRRPSF